MIFPNYVARMDCLVQIPNGLGALSGLAQLALYTFYRNATPRDLEEIQDVEADEKGQTMKPVPNSVYIQMEKNGDLSLNKQSGPLSKP